MKTYNNKIKEEKTSMLLLNILFAFAGAILLGFIYNYIKEIITYEGSLSETTIFNPLHLSLLSTAILFLFIPFITHNTNAASKVSVRDIKNKELKEKGLNPIDEVRDEEVARLFKNAKIIFRSLFAVLGTIILSLGYFYAEKLINGISVNTNIIVLVVVFAFATIMVFGIFEKDLQKLN